MRRLRRYQLFLSIVAGSSSAACEAFAAAPLNYLSSHGTKADITLGLTLGVTAISTFVVLAIAALLAFALWRRPGLAQEPGERIAVTRPAGGVSWLWIGTGISTAVLCGTIIWTVEVLAQVAEPPTPAPVTIEVTGQQWWWQVRYLSADPSRVFTTANEIHIPVGEPVRFRLIGGDVIHSFWVPQLAGKMDAIPGQTNETWLEAAGAGNLSRPMHRILRPAARAYGFLVIAAARRRVPQAGGTSSSSLRAGIHRACASWPR